MPTIFGDGAEIFCPYVTFPQVKIDSLFNQLINFLPFEVISSAFFHITQG